MPLKCVSMKTKCPRCQPRYQVSKSAYHKFAETTHRIFFHSTIVSREERIIKLRDSGEVGTLFSSPLEASFLMDYRPFIYGGLASMTAEFGEIICFRLVTDKAWDNFS